MKYYTIISLLLICLQFTSCHKKHSPTPSWELVSSQGNFTSSQLSPKSVVVYNNELILYDVLNKTLYRYDINANLIEKKSWSNVNKVDVQLYTGFYTVNSWPSYTQSDSITINSYTTSGNSYHLDLRSYLTNTNDIYLSELASSFDATLPATMNSELNTTPNRFFFTIYQADTSNGQINGITKITSINIPNFNGTEYIFGFKGNYIFSGDGTYLLKSDGSYQLTHIGYGGLIPQFVYQDSLYATDNVDLYSTYDGTSWNVKGTLNSSLLYQISNINNRLLVAHTSGDLSEYHPESNTYSSLSGNGLGQVNGYALLGGYVYAFGNGLYRIKYSDLFQ